MTRDDLRYIPHNFAEFMNSDIIDQHKALLSSSDYSEAVNLLNQNLQVEGMRADLFNTIEQKILFVANQLEYILYQNTEPTDAEFAGKVIWAQQY